MLGLIQQSLVGFGTFVMIQVAQSSLAWSRFVKTDETALVKGRLSPTIAKILDESGVRVKRVSTEKSKMIAETRFVFPRTFIVIDYDERSFTSREEDVIIAHEIAHVRANHPVLKTVIDCLFGALVVSVALQLAAAERGLAMSAIVLLSVILVGFYVIVLPISRILARRLEFDADDYAVEHAGLENTLGTLRTINEVAGKRPFAMVACSMDDRIAHLKNR